MVMDIIEKLQSGSMPKIDGSKDYSELIAAVCERDLEYEVKFILAIHQILLPRFKKSIADVTELTKPPSKWPLLGPVVEWIDNKDIEMKQRIVGNSNLEMFQEMLEVSLEIIKDEPVFIIEKLFEKAELRNVLMNVLLLPTPTIREKIFQATSVVTQSPIVTAHLLYSLSRALRDVVEEPNVSAAYYEGFTYSQQSNAAVGVNKTNVNHQEGYTWTPVPMLRALSETSKFRLTCFFSDYRKMLLYLASQNWNHQQKLTYDREFQKWINLEAGKFRVQTEYDYEEDFFGSSNSIST